MINRSIYPETISVPTFAIEPIPSQSHIYSLSQNQPNYDVKFRLNTLNENLRLQHLNSEEKQSIKNICNEFNDIFYLPIDKLTRTTATTHNIPTTDNQPVHVNT